ncbi:MAG: hypothetical protein RL684_828 [Pseudomonadota bacterium]|jgi:tetratricopeptide (TPR) repeat protein
MQPDRYRRRLEAHVALGRYEAALATLSAWRERAPELLEPELLHARIDLGRGRLRAARTRALAAIRTRDCPPGLAIDVVQCLRVLVAHDALVEWARGYPHRAALTAADRANIVAALESIGAHAIARDWIETAVQDAPDDAAVRVNRALTRSYAGDFDGARADLEHAIASAQDPAIAHWMLSRLQRQTERTNHVERLRARIAAAHGDALDGEYLQFALFKELDDLGEHAAAWQALDEGCRLVRARAPYDRAASERLFGAITRRFPLDAPQAPVLAGEPTPIFIVGMHRSGTTLLESMLAAHPRVCAYGESLRLAGALRLAADQAGSRMLDEALVAAAASMDPLLVRDAFLAEGRWRIGASTHVTEKMPTCFQAIGFIRHAFPAARIIHLRRDPMDLCFANLRELFANGVEHSYALEDVAHFHALYLALMRHWHAIYPGFVLDIDYEALVRDPIAVSQRVFAFCGLDWSERVVDPAAWSTRAINTLSAVQARQAIGTGSIGRWRSYSRWLEPLRAALDAAPAGTA